METFEYTQGKVYRRKTFTASQKFILSSIWVLVSILMIGGIVLQQKGILPQGQLVLMLIIFLPLILAAILMYIVAINPKGPEADFIMPTVAIDPEDCSVIKGTVLLSTKEKLEVEVTVPNVYGSSVNVLDDTGLPGTGDISPEEMYDMALEEVSKKYPDSTWAQTPVIKS